jgi:hypothetical protein
MNGRKAVMDMGTDASTNWLPVAEAAPRLGLTVDGLRSRIRRGLVKPKKGNDGRLLVAVAMTSEIAGHDQFTDVSTDQGEADELRAEVMELRIALARTEERLAASGRREDDLQTLIGYLRSERDRLEAALAEARKGWLERLLEVVRRRP